MERLERLITQSRLETENTEFSDGAGIQDAEFIQAANNAQERLQGLIIQIHSRAFQTEKEIDVLSNTAEYDIPALAYLGFRVEKVEYSSNGQARNYYPLRKATLFERDPGSFGRPTHYIKRDKTLILDPTPNGGGKIRVTYQSVLPKLDIRRGVVGEVTLDSATLTITDLKCDPTQTIDSVEMKDRGYISIVDKDGNLKMVGIPVSDVNETSGAITLDGTFNYLSSESISVGDYVVGGKYSTSHCQLADSCEKYLIAFMNWKILKRDSSNDSQEQTTELGAMEEEIVASFAEVDLDIDRIPVINTDYLIHDGW